jgi:hypothetical protein
MLFFPNFSYSTLQPLPSGKTSALRASFPFSQLRLVLLGSLDLRDAELLLEAALFFASAAGEGGCFGVLEHAAMNRMENKKRDDVFTEGSFF